mmetsp:Transcript_734/g.2483  ORF Transcript_734/g.2483 Transcript_734/m.2483 type:complete len:306 (-) Transcript_734:329-1246(-)
MFSTTLAPSPAILGFFGAWRCRRIAWIPIRPIASLLSCFLDRIFMTLRRHRMSASLFSVSGSLSSLTMASRLSVTSLRKFGLTLGSSLSSMNSRRRRMTAGMSSLTLRYVVRSSRSRSWNERPIACAGRCGYRALIVSSKGGLQDVRGARALVVPAFPECKVSSLGVLIHMKSNPPTSTQHFEAISGLPRARQYRWGARRGTRRAAGAGRAVPAVPARRHPPRMRRQQAIARPLPPLPQPPPLPPGCPWAGLLPPPRMCPRSRSRPPTTPPRRKVHPRKPRMWRSPWPRLRPLLPPMPMPMPGAS